MAALDTGATTWGPRYSTLALHFAEPCSLGHPGDLILPAYRPQSSRRPRRRQPSAGPARPMTFHEGLLMTENDDETLESYLGLPNFDTSAASAQTSGPTIASIKCGADAETPQLYSEHVHPPPTPDLRSDTTCTPAPSGSSPLALVSNFLDTVAGMIKTPRSAAMLEVSDRKDDEIMIFGSEVFIDVYPEQRHSWFYETDIMSSSAWATSSMDWQLTVPLSDAQQHPMELSKGLDPLATAEHGRDPMDLTSLVWC